MKMRLRAGTSRGLSWLALWFVLYLAHSYLGNPFSSVYFFLTSLLALDLGHLFWAARHVHYFQHYSQVTPQRGDSVDYTVSINNQSWLPACRTRLVFGGIQSVSGSIELYPGSNGYFTQHFHIRCPNRGLNKAGLASLELTDMLDLLHVRIPVWQENLLVLPRVPILESCRIEITASGQNGFRDNAGESDPSLFWAMKDYQAGESVRHLDWKHLAASGKLRVRQFDASTLPALDIYFDRTKRAIDASADREAQDTMLETALALAQYFTANGATVRLRFGQGFEHYGCSQPEQKALLRRCALFEFSPAFQRQPVPATELLEDLRNGDSKGALTIGLFRSLDADTLDFLEAASAVSGENRSMAIIVGAGLAVEEAASIAACRERLDLQDRLIFIQEASGIRGALECT